MASPEGFPSMTEPMGQVPAYAEAERMLCAKLGPLLKDAIADVERACGVKIRELRVTVAADGEPWAGANCVIVE